MQGNLGAGVWGHPCKATKALLEAAPAAMAERANDAFPLHNRAAAPCSARSNLLLQTGASIDVCGHILFTAACSASHTCSNCLQRRNCRDSMRMVA